MSTDLFAQPQQFGQLSAQDLYSLEEYSRLRNDVRKKMLEHKKIRRIALGANLTLYFENRLTMRYQIQEVLRIEKIFESGEIIQELEAYNPLIPDGSNWKATMMIEYPEEGARREALSLLLGIENLVWVQVSGYDRVYAIADEDLERTTSEKTSAVHFLRFELSEKAIKALRGGAGLTIGVEHKNYPHVVESVTGPARESLLADLS